MREMEAESPRKKIIREELPNRIARIEFELESESHDTQGVGMKIIISSNVIDIWTGLKILLGLKLSNHTHSLTEASYLIDEITKRGEIQNRRTILKDSW